jgi:polyhydroxyalkanoate synthesis regulator phasin
MKDPLRKAMLVGLGLAVVTKEKADKVAKYLMKKGELNEKDAKKLVDKAAKEIDKTRAQIEKEVRREVERIRKQKRKR